MTEEEWLSGDDSGVYAMYEYIREKTTDRKLRLFGCGCCRRIWHLLEDGRSRRAVETAERFADCEIEPTKAAEAYSAANLAVHDSGTPKPHDPGVVRDATAFHAALAASWTTYPGMTAWQASTEATKAVRSHAWRVDRTDRDFVAPERRKQADLLRHIIGNPFRPYPAPPSWPSIVVQLAESLYAGQDRALALHDALLEAGHAELAEHFRQETWHPKGCWAVDVILGEK
jgi:hypothetical protein